MIGFILSALATAWTTIAVDAVVESTLDAQNRLVLFGRTVVLTGPTVEVFACVALGMSVAVVLTTWIQGSVQWRHEGTMRSEVDKGWEELSTRNAGMEGRNELLEWRLHDLQEQVDALAARRDALLAGRRDAILTDTQGDLEGTKEAARGARGRDPLRQVQDSMVVLPDLDPDGKGKSTPGSRPGAISSEGVQQNPA